MKGFFRNYNNIYNDVMPFFGETTNLLEADFYAGWNDLTNPDKRIVNLAKEYNKPSFILEHGMKAVSDYQKDLKDLHNGMGGKPFIADHMMVWGNKSRDIMLEAGVSDCHIHVVGSPVIWQHNYKYINKNSEEKWVPFNAGETVIDPKTKLEWVLEEIKSEIPRNEKRNIIAFFPHHDWTDQAIENNKKIWEEIKDIPNIFVKLSSNYMKNDEKNPFYDILSIEDHNERRTKAIGIDTTKPQNIQFIKLLLQKCKLVITAIPGTINGICWAMDVPVLMPEIDWGWRNNKGEPIFDIHSADYSCKLEDLEKTANEIIENDTKEKERLELAKEFMGIEAGNPVKNIIEVIKNGML